VSRREAPDGRRGRVRSTREIAQAIGWSEDRTEELLRAMEAGGQIERAGDEWAIRPEVAEQYAAALSALEPS
jgi:DNA-binding IclR family transcriptional regulator